MSRSIVPGAVLAALLGGAAQAAAPAPSPLPQVWVVQPADAACRAELELVGRSGAIVPVALVSDGQIVSLKFDKADLPERAFLPIRIDLERHSNLVLRSADGRSGELVLSEASEAALRKGGTLDIAWLTNEPVSVSLEGSARALTDLRTCGAQTAAEARLRAAQQAEAAARAEAEARAKAVAEAQIEAARAEAAAAEAERKRAEAEAQRQRRAEAAERERQYAEERRLAEAEAQRRRDYEAARRRAWEEEQSAYYRPPPPPVRWGYPRW